MKTLGTSLLSTLAFGLAVAAGARLLVHEGAARTAALVGAAVSTAVGALALVMKTAAPISGGTKGVQALLSRQVLALFLRLGAVGLGAASLHFDGAGALASLAFVVTFFIAYLGQQVVEVRSLLSVRQRAEKPEVTV
jgi:hypothetical protein